MIRRRASASGHLLPVLLTLLLGLAAGGRGWAHTCPVGPAVPITFPADNATVSGKLRVQVYPNGLAAGFTVYGWDKAFLWVMDAGFQIWFGGADHDWGSARMEGGDMMPAGDGVVLIGMGERSTARAASMLAQNLFAASAARLYATLPKYGIYTSNDGGNTWAKSSIGLPTKAQAGPGPNVPARGRAGSAARNRRPPGRRLEPRCRRPRRATRRDERGRESGGCGK